jgi:Universal stress protein family
MTKIAETEMPGVAGCPPVEVIEHDRSPVEVKRILVPTDLTHENDQAIEFGVVLARLFGAQLTLLHVYQDPPIQSNMCSALIRKNLRHRTGHISRILLEQLSKT